jgi:ammonium transporter, Amt family
LQPWAAIIIGATSGAIYCFASYFVSHVLKVDDPLDAAAVHAFCGAWGLLMAAAFSHAPLHRAAYGIENPADDLNGFLMGGNGKLLGAAICYILAITAWVLGHMIPFFYVMRFTGLLRVDEAEERAGLDVSHHGGAAYELAGTETALNGGKVVKESVETDALLSRYASFCICALVCHRRVQQS